MKTKTSNKNTSGASGHKMAHRPQIPESPPFSMFTCFNKLPLELRSMIWRLAEPKRTLYLTPPNNQFNDHATHLSGHRRILASVCTESRYETEKDYRCLTIARRSSSKLNTLPIFNPQIDTIYTRHWGWGKQRLHFLNLLEKPKEGEMIKKFAIHDRFLSYAFSRRRDAQRCITAFMKLEELSIVVGETKLHPTRAKVLEPVLEVTFDQKTFGGTLEEWQGHSCVSGWWGRGSAAEREGRFREIFDFMLRMQGAEKMREGTKIPVIKIVVLNKKDFQ